MSRPLGTSTVNDRTYARPHRQTVVVCIDGCDRPPRGRVRALADPAHRGADEGGAMVEARYADAELHEPNNV